ncbi:MAG: hypothetical protein ABIT08_02305 [Bacteroidia bacterium]
MKKNIFTVVILLLLHYAGAEKTFAQSSSTAAEMEADGCKHSLWKHVYDPSRLEIMDSCISVTGILKESKAEDDGDQHLLLQLDAGQDELLTKKNYKKKNDDLVLELVCANHIKDKKAKKACKGFKNNIQVPPVGTHVKVTGSYVIDSHNGWAEIHPVTKMEVVK